MTLSSSEDSDGEAGGANASFAHSLDASTSSEGSPLPNFAHVVNNAEQRYASDFDTADDMKAKQTLYVDKCKSLAASEAKATRCETEKEDELSQLAAEREKMEAELNKLHRDYAGAILELRKAEHRDSTRQRTVTSELQYRSKDGATIFKYGWGPDKLFQNAWCPVMVLSMNPAVFLNLCRDIKDGPALDLFSAASSNKSLKLKDQGGAFAFSTLVDNVTATLLIDERRKFHAASEELETRYRKLLADQYKEKFEAGARKHDFFENDNVPSLIIRYIDTIETEEEEEEFDSDSDEEEDEDEEEDDIATSELESGKKTSAFYVHSHEGRHRAMQCLLQGKRMPVKIMVDVKEEYSSLDSGLATGSFDAYKTAVRGGHTLKVFREKPVPDKDDTRAYDSDFAWAFNVPGEYATEFAERLPSDGRAQKRADRPW
jgi:hypothetical protein